ncbi:MAG: hypothetical protein AB1540_12270 [Bdellovibrionota bacterium]
MLNKITLVVAAALAVNTAAWAQLSSGRGRVAVPEIRKNQAIEEGKKEAGKGKGPTTEAPAAEKLERAAKQNIEAAQKVTEAVEGRPEARVIELRPTVNEHKGAALSTKAVENVEKSLEGKETVRLEGAEVGKAAAAREVKEAMGSEPAIELLRSEAYATEQPLAGLVAKKVNEVDPVTNEKPVTPEVARKGFLAFLKSKNIFAGKHAIEQGFAVEKCSDMSAAAWKTLLEGTTEAVAAAEAVSSKVADAKLSVAERLAEPSKAFREAFEKYFERQGFDRVRQRVCELAGIAFGKAAKVASECKILAQTALGLNQPRVAEAYCN